MRKNAEREGTKMDEVERKKGWDSEKIYGIFSRKCVEEQKMERRVTSIFGFLRVWIALVEFESLL